MSKYLIDTKEERDREAISAYNEPILLEIDARKKEIQTYEGLLNTVEYAGALYCLYEAKITKYIEEIESLKNDLIKDVE